MCAAAGFKIGRDRALGRRPGAAAGQRPTPPRRLRILSKHSPHIAFPASGRTAPHTVHSPLAVRSVRLRRADAPPLPAHAAHIFRPSAGGSLPHVMHSPSAANRARPRRTPAATVSMHPAHQFRPSFGGALPHFEHAPAARKPAPLSRMYDARVSAHPAHHFRPSAGLATPHRAQTSAAARSVRLPRSRRPFLSAHPAHHFRPSLGGALPHPVHWPAASRAASLCTLRDLCSSAHPLHTSRPSAGGTLLHMEHIALFGGSGLAGHGGDISRYAGPRRTGVVGESSIHGRCLLRRHSRQPPLRLPLHTALSAAPFIMCCHQPCRTAQSGHIRVPWNGCGLISYKVGCAVRREPFVCTVCYVTSPGPPYQSGQGPSCTMHYTSSLCCGCSTMPHVQVCGDGRNSSGQNLTRSDPNYHVNR